MEYAEIRSKARKGSKLIPSDSSEPRAITLTKSGDVLIVVVSRKVRVPLSEERQAFYDATDVEYIDPAEFDHIEQPQGKVSNAKLIEEEDQAMQDWIASQDNAARRSNRRRSA